MNSHTLYFTRRFTRGLLAGCWHHDSVTFPTVAECVRFAKRGTKGFKGTNWKIIDYSFQKYAR